MTSACSGLTKRSYAKGLLTGLDNDFDFEDLKDCDLDCNDNFDGNMTHMNCNGPKLVYPKFGQILKNHLATKLKSHLV